ncbi:MAG: HAD-superfamily hydrolase, subfamily variant 3 [Phycisphaerales bacterium]|nr:HAD-superfamily hydrolase, subfamily variant 3 [Phycisphaerales bacterium]
MMEQRLVVFDLGRVLVRICDGWQHAFELAGVGLSVEQMDAAVRAHLHAGVCRIEVGEGEVADFCRTAAGHLQIPEEAVTRMWRGYTLGPYPGVAELIEELHRAGAATACLSNTNAEHWRVLMDPADAHGRALGGLKHRFASHLVRARKPDAAIYAHLERETGFDPAWIIFFDDVAENVEAARERGWRAHLVERCENPIPGIRQVLRDEGVLA